MAKRREVAPGKQAPVTKQVAGAIKASEGHLAGRLYRLGSRTGQASGAGGTRQVGGARQVGGTSGRCLKAGKWCKPGSWHKAGSYSKGEGVAGR